MKKFLLGLLVLIFGMGATYYYFTNPIVHVAEDFFKSVKEDNLTKAESYLSEGFKSNTSHQQLAQYLVNYKMTDYKSLSWEFNKKINGDEATIKGSMINQDDTSSPLTLQFKKEEGEWKIFFIEKVLSDAEVKKQKLITEYTKLSRISMHYLGQALADNNMSILYNNISQLWQKETNITELKKTYGIFSEKKVNLLVLDKISPKLTHVELSKKSILSLDGFYVVGKNHIFFKEKYIPENKIWKLISLSIEIK